MLFVCVAACLVLCLFTGTARASSMSTDCAGLQAALDQAVSGDTITLTEMCVGQTFDLSPRGDSNQSYTLTGQPGSGAGFDGTGAAGSILSASNASTPTSLTLSDLVFQNGLAAATGGAVVFQGDYSVNLDHDTFTGNQAPGIGGAVDVETSSPDAAINLTNNTFSNNEASDPNSGLGGAVNIIAFGSSSSINIDANTYSGNSAGLGGGAIEISDGSTAGQTTISNSTFDRNGASDTGGAVDLCECGAALPVTLTHNTFQSNEIVGTGCDCTIAGGAVFLANSAGGNATLEQSGNSFSSNSVIGGGGNAQGGAEATFGMNLTGTADQFSANQIQAPVAGSAAQGSALSLAGDCTAPGAEHTITNSAFTGNQIEDGGAAASANGTVSDSCVPPGPDPATLTIANTTMSANFGGGGTSGVWVGADGQLTVGNSIINGDSDGAELSGSGAVITVSYSDLCMSGEPYPGNGNLCVAPQLVDAARGDVHETAASPTVDMGSNALAPGGVSSDVYGAARIQPRYSGGRPVIDIGAAELPSVQPPSPPTASIVAPKSDATYAVGQRVAADFSCAEGAGGSGISSCVGTVANGTPIDTASAGQHTFSVTVASTDGQSTTTQVSYTVAAAPKVTISRPADGARFVRGQRVTASFSCAEGAAGPGISSCVGSTLAGRPISTSAPGVHSFTVSALSRDGQRATSTVRYRVLWPSNHLVRPPRVQPRRDGRIVVTVKVPHRGRTDILVTAWNDNVARAAAIRAPAPVTLQPAPGRFVFARARRVMGHPGTYRIVVVPNARGRRLVRHPRYRVTLRLWISYTPWGGRPGKLGFYGLKLP